MVLIVVVALCSSVSADVLLNRHFFLNVANDSGVLYDWDYTHYNVDPPPDRLSYSTQNLPGEAPNTYFMKADGGGVTEMHLTTDVINYNYGNRTAVDSPDTNPSGTIYFTNTGGRGFDNDIILLLSVKGPIPDDFSLHVTSSGYTWTPAPSSTTSPAPPTDYVYVPVGIDETFTKSDFIYGPQVARPGPGGVAGTDCFLPLYYGQDTTDSSTAAHLMFIDLKVGNLSYGKFSGVTLTDLGAVKVQFSFTGLASIASFNGYGWVSAANQGEGINFSNDTTFNVPSASGYMINYTGPPVVISVTPADAANSIPTNSIISATFNTAMDGSTINADTFMVQDPFGGTVERHGTV